MGAGGVARGGAFSWQGLGIRAHTAVAQALMAHIYACREGGNDTWYHLWHLSCIHNFLLHEQEASQKEIALASRHIRRALEADLVQAGGRESGRGWGLLLLGEAELVLEGEGESSSGCALLGACRCVVWVAPNRQGQAVEDALAVRHRAHR